MPMNGYSVGRDISLDIITETGPLNISVRTGFQSKQETSSIEVKRLDGIVDNLELPAGWSGNFDVERQDDRLSGYIAQLEERYYSGLNVRGISITETVRNADGSVSQYRYQNVVVKLTNAGEWKGDATVKQGLDFKASRRLKIA